MPDLQEMDCSYLSPRLKEEVGQDSQCGLLVIIIKVSPINWKPPLQKFSKSKRVGTTWIVYIPKDSHRVYAVLSD